MVHWYKRKRPNSATRCQYRRDRRGARAFDSFQRGAYINNTVDHQERCCGCEFPGHMPGPYTASVRYYLLFVNDIGLRSDTQQ